jgi:hypothetical protein
VQSSASSRVPSWYKRLAADFDAADARASALVSGLTSAQLNWKPRADAWSVGQCLEHLCLSGEVYAGPMTDALRGRPTGPVDEITPGWFGRWFIRTYIEPETQKTRARAPRKIVPVASSVDPSILNRFIASNASIRQVMDRAREFDVNRVRFVNPFVGWIRFTVGTGMQIIARHNHRHLLQAERVRQHPEFPAAAK